jgi:hypothetical protein
MHVVTTERRSGEAVYNATLLRRSYRQDGKVKKETLANLSHLPPEAIDAIRRVLRGEMLMSVEDAFETVRSLPAGHVNAALLMARRLGFAGLLDPRSCRERDLCMAMILGRVIKPASKLGTVRALSRTTLAQELGVVGCDEDELYRAMDWLLERQPRSCSRRGIASLAVRTAWGSPSGRDGVCQGVGGGCRCVEGGAGGSVTFAWGLSGGLWAG